LTSVLAAGDLLDVASVDQHQLEFRLQQVPDRLPVVAGGLHHDVRHAVCPQPVGQYQQPGHRRLELLDLADPLAVGARHPDARGHLRLMDVQRALARHDHVHPDPLLDDDRTVARTGPREQTTLGSALTAAGPGSGRGPHVKLNHGLTSTKKHQTSANDAANPRARTTSRRTIIFTGAQAAGEAGQEN